MQQSGQNDSNSQSHITKTWLSAWDYFPMVCKLLQATQDYLQLPNFHRLYRKWNVHVWVMHTWDLHTCAGQKWQIAELNTVSTESCVACKALDRNVQHLTTNCNGSLMGSPWPVYNEFTLCCWAEGMVVPCIRNMVPELLQETERPGPKTMPN